MFLIYTVHILLIFQILFQKLTNYGTISVDGEAGTVNYRSGGGSGGTLKITAASFVGRGTVSSYGGGATTQYISPAQVGKFG